MKKPWRYHGECCASGGPAAKTLGACGPSGFGLGTSLGTTFTMIPPRLFQIMSHYTAGYLKAQALRTQDIHTEVLVSIIGYISSLVLG